MTSSALRWHPSGDPINVLDVGAQGPTDVLIEFAAAVTPIGWNAAWVEISEDAGATWLPAQFVTAVSSTVLKFSNEFLWGDVSTGTALYRFTTAPANYVTPQSGTISI